MNYFMTIRKNVSATAAVCHGVYIPTETILYILEIPGFMV